MAAGLGGEAPPAGPHWTAHPPGSRGLSWRHRFTHKTAQSETRIDHELHHHHTEGAALSTSTLCLSVTQSIKHWHLKRKMS